MGNKQFYFLTTYSRAISFEGAKERLKVVCKYYNPFLLLQVLSKGFITRYTRYASIGWHF